VYVVFTLFSPKKRKNEVCVDVFPLRCNLTCGHFVVVTQEEKLKARCMLIDEEKFILAVCVFKAFFSIQTEIYRNRNRCLFTPSYA
jgi:hypothetical protein